MLQFVTGDAAAIGEALCESNVVRKLSFIGSTQVGRLLMRRCAPTIKKLSLELGGNAPLIVFDDADVERAVEGIIASKFRNAGQTCVCANRIYVQAGIHDRIVERLAAAVDAMRVGNGLEPGVTQGPLIDGRAVDKVPQHIDEALSLGARLAVGGAPAPLGGTFFAPTVLTGVTQAMRVANEVAPFGGVKQSGLGREGSRHGIEEYLEPKYVCMQD